MGDDFVVHSPPFFWCGLLEIISAPPAVSPTLSVLGVGWRPYQCPLLSAVAFFWRNVVVSCLTWVDVVVFNINVDG